MLPAQKITIIFHLQYCLSYFRYIYTVTTHKQKPFQDMETGYQLRHHEKLHKCTLLLFALHASLFSFLLLSLVHCYSTPEERRIVAWTWNIIKDLYTFNLRYSQGSYCNGMPHMFQREEKITEPYAILLSVVLISAMLQCKLGL